MSSSTRTRRRWRRLAVSAICSSALLAAAPTTATAHPLGNFSVNRLHTITLTPTSVVDEVIVDHAEIPTTQQADRVDVDGDGSASPSERRAHAMERCAEIAVDTSFVLDGGLLDVAVSAAEFSYSDGEAGLETSRLMCRLEASVDLTGRSEPVVLEFDDDARTGRVGWNEINAIGDGVALVDPPVPASSITDGLRVYPVDLLESPLDVRSVALTIDPDPPPGDTGGIGSPRDTGAADARDQLVESRPGFIEERSVGCRTPSTT